MIKVEHVSIWLKSLKIINLLKNRLSVDIDFKYRLDTNSEDVFYVVEDEEFECRIRQSDGFDYITIFNRDRNIIMGAAEIVKVGKVSLLRLSKEHFLGDIVSAYRGYELNMRLLESIK